jgi:hypothetical protein
LNTKDQKQQLADLVSIEYRLLIGDADVPADVEIGGAALLALSR